MRRHMFTKLTVSFISLSAVVVLAILMSPVLTAADRPPPPPQETNGLAPSEPTVEPRAPARAGRRAPIEVRNSSQPGPAASADPPVSRPSSCSIPARSAALGRPVRSAANESMGRIIDIIVDRAGVVRAAVIDFGGFLGVGSRKIRSIGARYIRAGGMSITVELTRDQVKAAPEYQEGKPVTVLGAMNDSDGSRLSLVSSER